MKNGLSWLRAGALVSADLLGVVALCSILAGCARLQVPVQVVHEDERLLVRTERVGDGNSYTHPAAVTAEEMASLLKGLSVSERPGAWPLRMFGKTAGPDQLIREDDIQAVASSLAEGLRVAKSGERVAFVLSSPGTNPEYERVVTSGWIAVRGPYLHVGVDYLRNLQPRSTGRGYYPFYQELPPSTPPYDVSFDPPKFWVTDPADGQPALQFREALSEAAKGGQ